MVEVRQVDERIAFKTAGGTGKDATSWSMPMSRIPRFTASLVVLLCCVRLATAADDPQAAIVCSDGSAWYTATSATLRADHPDSPDFAEWKLTFASDRDMKIDVDSRHGEKTEHGTLMLVSGRALLIKDLPVEDRYAIDAIDAPLLIYKLAITLLDQAIPEGPDRVDSARKIDVSEAARAIHVATPSAGGDFAAPWSITGTVERQDSTTIKYSLLLEYADPAGRRKVPLHGTWGRSKKPPVMDETMNVEGWRLYALGPMVLKQEGNSILDFGAQTKPVAVKTLGQLREVLRKEEEASAKSKVSK